MKPERSHSTYTNSVAAWLVALLLNCTAGHAVDRYVSLEGGHVPPFTDWASAATNIQEAIDASVDGDVIWVTNGVYAVGGKVMAGDLTNRVALDKALTVRSVNGAAVTTIQGQWDPTITNGPGAVRCAWLTNGATLSGFTLQGGATRNSGDSFTLQSGGGVWCFSSNSVVENCRITGNVALHGGGSCGGFLIHCQINNNSAFTNGGGSYSGYIGGPNSAFLNSCELNGNLAFNGGGAAFVTLRNCRIRNNRANNGGGAYSGTVVNSEVLGNIATVRGGGLHGYSFSGALIANNSRIAGNTAGLDGGGVYAASSSEASLKNCTLTGNTASASGGGSFQATLGNCIIYYNYAPNFANTYIGSPSSIQYCCMTEVRTGAGNIISEPLFLADGWHLSSNSPCRSAGSFVLTSGTDFDGQAWTNPPSMGCDQWRPEPGIATPVITPAAKAIGRIEITAVAGGQEPFYYSWLKDGAVLEDDFAYSGSHISTLLVSVADPAVVGEYQLVATNSFGTVTSQVAKVTLCFVDINGSNPVPPYSTWPTAAPNIQDAIDAAQPGDVVVVTNGVYALGGIVSEGLTNRVMLDKAVTVQSVNGPEVTIIQGAWHPGTNNGPAAVRCAWLTDGAGLGGFTLRGGATLTDTNSIERVVGGGLRCLSTNAIVANCWITGNAAYQSGAGAFSGSLINCIVANNSVALDGGGAYRAGLNSCKLIQNLAGRYGGGSYQGNLYNCAVRENQAGLSGGGSYNSALNNCTVTGNSSRLSSPGGVNGGQLRNCIVMFNSGVGPNNNINFAQSVQYTCSSPLPSGTGNLNVDPGLLADGYHIASDSPCRGAGSLAFVGGLDIDIQSWANPPAMGCDEWHPEPLIIVQPSPRPATGTGQARMFAAAAGQGPLFWNWQKDGLLIEDGVQYASAHTASVLIKDFGLDDAGGYQVVVSNAFGMSTSQIVQVSVHCVDALSATAIPPYSTWATAAATIQDAIEAAKVGDVILVTNGIYASGGKVMVADLTNRVALDKAVLVTSVNGPAVTIIEGQWDPVSTNGPGAVRCAWMTGEAGLSGFTLRNGATSDSTGDGGGGVWCASTNAELANCVITNCATKGLGGGVRSGTLNTCILTGNSAGTGGGAIGSVMSNSRILRNTASFNGGGVSSSSLYNCLLNGNTARQSGGGSDSGRLVNCTVTANSAGFAGGCDSGRLTNCIVYFNSAALVPNVTAVVAYSCTTPQISGVGNFSADPQLTDGVHLAATSPCRGMGSSLAVTGTDFEGDPWANPPSLGCDEVLESSFVGPLSVGLTAGYPEVAAYGAMPLIGQVIGRASRLEWSFGDGPVFTNLSYLTSHAWTNPGDYTVTFTAYNAENPAGVSTNLVVHVVPLTPPLMSPGGLSGTNFSLSFPGQPGVTYVVEQTTNLVPPVTWRTVQSVFSTGALMQVTDTRATNAMRFYRVRTQ